MEPFVTRQRRPLWREVTQGGRLVWLVLSRERQGVASTSAEAYTHFGEQVLSCRFKAVVIVDGASTDATSKS